jgi:hypothetical protein
MQERADVTKVDQVERLMQRPLLYNNIDGVGELGLGFMFLGSALLQWLPIHASWWHRYGSFLGFMLLITAIHYGVKAIKTRITYPRTGFVEYRRRDFFWKGMIAGAVVGLVFGVGATLAQQLHWKTALAHLGLTTPAALFGLVIAAGYAYGIAKVVPWKVAVAAAMAICSIAIAVLPQGVIGSMTANTSDFGALVSDSVGALLLTFMLYGAILLISGGISFALYMRRTQPVAETAE